MKRAFLLGVVPLALAGACATASAGDDLSEKAAARLAEFDRTGETRSCLSLRSVTQITPLSEKLLLVRVGVGDFYLNEVSGTCSNADTFFTRLEYRTSLSQLCRGEILHIVDNSTGIFVGACSFGDFERLEKKKEAPAEEDEAE